MTEQTKPWRRNMWIVWAALFVMNGGFSLIMPFLPLYVKQLGHGAMSDAAVKMWTGGIMSANFLVAAFSLPFWGGMADRFGRRAMMIRAGIGMGVVVTLMGFATSPLQLLLLRLLQGTTVGFMPAAIAYMTTITPKDRVGYMLSIVQTAPTTGTIIAPMIGGVMAHYMGYAHIFWATGIGCFLSGLIAWLFLREEFTPVPQEKRTTMWQDLAYVGQNPTLVAVMVVVLVQQLSVMNAEPIITPFLQTLQVPAQWLALISGLVFSVVGIADLVASPFLGRRGDKIGYKRVLTICLTGVTIMYPLQGLAHTWWQLLLLRYGQGSFMGGVLASASALLSLSAPREFQGRAFGVNTGAMQTGNFLGPLIGGFVAGWLGDRAVFPLTGLLCLINLLWVRTAIKEPVRSA